MILGKGIDQISEVIAATIYYKLIEQKGMYYNINDKEKFKGKEKLILFLKENPVKFQELKKEIYKIIRGEM